MQAARFSKSTGPCSAVESGSRARERDTRTLIITGYAFSCPELRDHDFLLKPVRPDELLNEIERLLGSAP